MDPVEQAKANLADIQRRMATIGEDIAKGERSTNARFEGLDAKVDAVKRSLALIEDHTQRAQVTDWYERTDGSSDFGDLIERDATGAVVGVRFADSREAVVVDPLTQERGIADAPGLLDSKPRNEWQSELQRAVLHLQLARSIGAPKLEARARGALIRLWQRAPAQLRQAREVMHRQGSQLDPRLWGGIQTRASGGQGSAAGTGSEWVPQEYAGIYRPWAFMGREMSPFSVRRVSGPVVVPTFSGTPRPRGTSMEGSADPAKYRESRVTTSSDTISVPQMTSRIAVNAGWLEDAAPGSLDEFLFLINRGMSWAKIDALLHGDAAATHQDAIASWTNGIWDASDSDLGGSTDHRTLYEALRADAHDNSAVVDASGAASFIAALVLALEQHGPRAMQRMVAYLSIQYMISSVMTDPKLVTLDVAGGNATIASDPNSNRRVFNVDLIPTSFLRPEFETTGLYTDGSGAKDIIVTACTDDWEIVERSDDRAIVADKTTGHIHIVQQERSMLRKRESASTLSAAVARNL